MPKQPDEEPTLDEEERDIAQRFAVIQRSMLEAKKRDLTQAQAKKALEAFKEALGGLDDAAVKQLLADSELQDALTTVSRTSGNEPGAPIYDEKGREIGSVPFTYEDFCRIYPMQEWIPPRDDTISVNGVTLRVYEGRPHRAPKVFYDIQMEAIQRERYARNVQAEVLRSSAPADGTTLEVGWTKQEITPSTPGWTER